MKKKPHLSSQNAQETITNTIEEKQTMPRATPRSEIGSNDMNTTLMEIELVYI
jgi:hypothetical protein